MVCEKRERKANATSQKESSAVQGRGGEMKATFERDTETESTLLFPLEFIYSSVSVKDTEEPDVQDCYRNNYILCQLRKRLFRSRPQVRTHHLNSGKVKFVRITSVGKSAEQ
ncbi:hypothetical protein CEXT_122021 [Caerostris extrusa]|uniref:Uncharacterized protein n=1 Tax=Caerostris extrusa TaxID=172846 RepID=A0AAV4W057_CAEEX|nr:hypothetical protein CEXT_122021 [Caerostris extrusa]